MSGNDPESQRRQAENDFVNNPQTPKKDSNQFQHWEQQQAYNAELERQRQAAEERRRQQGS